jgi:biotin operon repressor
VSKNGNPPQKGGGLEVEKQILEHLKRYHTGRVRAVSSPFLEARFHIRGATLRGYINALRSDGNPICSDETGYYYASSGQELSATIRQLSSRIGKIAGAKNGLVRAMSLFPDESQISLPI